MSKKCKVFNFDIKQVGPEEDRVLRFIGSDETPDRDNDIIEVAGWKLDEYLKNPVFLWAHRYDEPPIGKAINVMTDMATKKLLFDIKFPTADEYPFADTIYKLYKGGYLNATSVGFRGIKFKTRDDESVLEKPEWQRGRRYMEQSLLELSAVPVPCNPNALQTVRSKGFTDEDIDKVFFEEKTVIPYKKFPLADEGTAWDGPAEVAAASVEDLKIMCAWYDAENADVKQSYKLPHHTASGYKTVWRAVAAAMAALLGARGGVQIPEGDRKGVYNHLSKHYADFDKEPPDFKEYTEAELKAIFPDEQKSGATLSAKTKKMLDEIHAEIHKCNDRLRKFIDNSGIIPDEEPEEEGKALTVKVELIEEFKQALDEIKSQVLILSQKTEKQDANKVEIDLDAIELPKAKKDPAEIELNIEPGELKNMIAQIIKEQLQGGIKNES